MEPERRAWISDIYHRALARAPEERSAFLREACHGDTVLLNELETLFLHESDSTRFLEIPAFSVSDPVTSSDTSHLIGQQFGPYTIVAPLGAGGMGEVYRARDNRLGRDVAIKILSLHLTADPGRRSRFAREARLLATLNHPHIGSIYGLEESNGLTGLVLELVEGPTLADRLARGPLPIPQALSIARQIADAIEAAHEKGIVHRDLKPDNVVLQPTSSANDVRAKVLDFGLAKALDQPKVLRSGSTEDGRILGTPSYMSPEQARGRAVDKRTDIWAFGCVLYEMLTGRRAFVGDTMSDTFVRVLEHEPDWSALPAGTSANTRTLLERCLRKDPGKRLHDIADARVEIEESRAGRTTWVLWPRLLTLASIALGVLSLIGFWVWMSTPRSAHQPPSLRRLTFDDGLQIDPTFSADASLIAYTSNRSGNFDIWMQPVGGGKAVQVTDDPAHDTQPDWSPKGNQIVFRSERDGGGLFVAPATGGRAERVAAFGFNPRWSPDGSRILFLGSAFRGAGRGQVYTVGLDGAPPRAVDMSLRLGGSVGWHPSGRVTFLNARNLQLATVELQLAVVDLLNGTTTQAEVSPDVQEGMQAQFLITGPTQMESHLWAPDGRTLYFVGFSKGIRNIWSLDVNPRTLAIVGGPNRVTTMPQSSEHIALTRTGAAIAFAAVDRTSRIRSYPMDAAGRVFGGGAELLTPAELLALSPDFTPDGSSFLYRAWQLGSGTGRTELRIVRNGVESTGPVDGGFGPRWEIRFWPRWSPDSHRIVYRYTRLQQPADANAPSAVVNSLELWDVEKGVPMPLTTPWSASEPINEIAYGWSPDSRFVVSSSGRYKPGERSIALLPISAAPHAETQPVVVTSSAEYGLWNTGMSLNERLICFNATKGTSSRIGFVEKGTGKWHWVTNGSSWADKPRWSADGRLLYFVSSQGGLLNIWAVEVDPDHLDRVRQPFQVSHFDASTEQILPDLEHLELAVAKGRLAVPTLTPTGSIWMLENLK